MTDSSKTTNQSQQSTTSPWAPAQGLLQNLIGQYGGQSTSVTPEQSAALANLQSSTSGLPNFGDQGTGAVNNLFSSSTQPQVGMLQNAYGSLQNNLGATASGANLDPYSTPGFGDALKTMTSDITNATKGVYAGSGRDPSGAGSFAGSLGRGLTQGLAPTIASQYNQNYGNMIGANNSLFSGAGSTASGINNLQQTQLGNQLTGIQAAGSIPGLYSSPGQAQLGVANQAYQQPYQNLAALFGPSVGLAGLGSQSSGSGTSTQTSSPSLLSSIQQGMSAGGTALSGLGSLAPLLMLSDMRAKKDIAKVGQLHDGQPVFSFKYKGADKPQIGLIAQHVEKVHPEAVTEMGGLKHVNYDLATKPSRMMAGPVGILKRVA